MASKLVSLARVIFLSKTAASRSAPAAIVGPLQRSFGGGADENHTDDDNNENENEQQIDNVNGGDEKEAAVEQLTTTTTLEEQEQEQEQNNKGIFAALVARAEATAAGGPGPAAAEFQRGGGPIASPFARHELRESVQEYYRTAIMAGRNTTATTSPDIAVNDQVTEPDLSIPVGDEFLYLAQ